MPLLRFPHSWRRIPGTIAGLAAAAWCALAAFANQETPPPEADGPPWTVSVAWYKTARPSQHEAVLSSVRGMLKEDWENAASGPASAQKHYVAAVALCPGDPRIPYACGLVLWHHDRHADAIARFEQVQTVADVFFSPAYQAAAWCRFDQSQLREGVGSLQRLTARLIGNEGLALDPVYRLELCEWLGRMVELAHRLDEPQALRGDLTKLMELCTRGREAAISQRFQQGRDQLSQAYGQLTQLSQRNDDEIRGELQPQLQALRKELIELAEALAKERAEIALQQKQCKDAEAKKNQGNRKLTRVREETAEASKPILALIPQLNAAEQTARSRMSTKTKSVLVKEAKSDKGDDKYEDRPKSAAELDADRTAWNNAHTDLKAALDRVSALRKRLSDAETAAADARQNAVDTGRQSSPVIRSLRQSVVAQDARQRLVKRRNQQLDGWIAVSASFRAHVKTIPPYVPWYADDERDDVLRSFATSK